MMMFNGRSAKPWGSFREGAANLDKLASDSRISKATRVIMLASFSLMTMTRMEVAVADPIVTQQVFQVEHVKIESTKKFAEVEAALDASIPQLDPAIGAALANGKEKRAKELERGAELFIFLKRDHGALLQITGRPRKALQYEIGNPLTATRMTRHQIPARSMRRYGSYYTRTQWEGRPLNMTSPPHSSGNSATSRSLRLAANWTPSSNAPCGGPRNER